MKCSLVSPSPSRLVTREEHLVNIVDAIISAPDSDPPPSHAAVALVVSYVEGLKEHVGEVEDALLRIQQYIGNIGQPSPK